MRFYVTHEEWPTSESVIAAARAANCAEIRHTDALAGGVHEEAEPVSAVPVSVTRAQAKIALARANLFEAAVEAIAAAPLEAQIWWSEADTFRRDNPWVATIGAVLGLAAEETDDLFRAAALIE